MYQLFKEPRTAEVIAIIRLDDHIFIPFDLANTSYQEYLQWLAEGNEPLPADEPETTE